MLSHRPLVLNVKELGLCARAASPVKAIAPRAMEAAPIAGGVRRNEEGLPAESTAAAAQPAAKTSPTSRPKRPRIDLDDSIAQARAAMHKAKKDVAEARRLARNERRKKQRLVKKAGSLSADDLERIAVLKRCGLTGKSSDAALLEPAPPSKGETSASHRDAAPSSPLRAPALKKDLPAERSEEGEEEPFAGIPDGS